ncbi:7TM GPCR serpentine receptor class x (Srx) domain-containing protein [Caenorhabditis elegans]|uniref:7TM GPCR serpentine receptor class x (Srx) domain-containing protein n=1 Tax=Caenorhabditis elegans TaxID=6239 RepID=O02072_CAEEL|nr:7TM GPCR serpentine receptor class x (Srx) domain-containing protein [Caenorhabditis elegans]CCD69698.1 7TM GPCR serpentine receptor class x (Srx) domain-containing protein [Caenorhabditis elegans]|eukprot:NP_494610.2 Serpentine Receptor, class X [Caenorhabditis elegans]
MTKITNSSGTISVILKQKSNDTLYITTSSSLPSEDWLIYDSDIEEDIATPLMTTSAGIVMILLSAFGIFINILVLHRFIAKNMSSFYLLCSSKTVSNSIILFCYLVYNGPVSVLQVYYGPEMFNILFNQIAAYGVYIQGPMTQVCISFNRFMVIYFVSLAKRKSGRVLTITALSICWTISLIVTVIGIPDKCTNIYLYEYLTWDYSDSCVFLLADLVLYWIICLAIVSNTFNVMVAVKLIVSSKKSHLDTMASKRRKKTSRNLFLQSCFQDWIYLIDTVNGMYIYNWFNSVTWQFGCTILSNLMVHVSDGCIMLFFNYEKKHKIPKTIVKRDFTAVNVTF